MHLKGFLIDLDGVLYIGGKPVPGAAETIRYLDRHGYPYRFVSNTTRKSRRSIAAHLGSLGLQVSASLIFTPPAAAVSHMLREGRTRCLLLTTCDVHTEFTGSGITVAEESVDFVVVGDAGDNFTYDLMNKAFRMVLGGAGILALEKDRYWMGAGGMMLSAGPFVAALEYATGARAELVGKPSARFFELALRDMGISASGAAMIGDDLFTDVGGALASGLTGILVRTGKFRPDLLQDPASPSPDAVLDSISDLPDILG
ncbi:MAG: TIGR01458 family HAD-type hydrolase [Methanoregulaceae archaeon]|nr:TIGR01458 family HAD-type hydrolase [Methanoregulaceae archaeon]